MPGPVSDSFDPEFGTSANAEEIGDALEVMYARCSEIIVAGIGPNRDPKPMPILDLVRADLPAVITGRLTEKEWRLIRFALERSLDYI